MQRRTLLLAALGLSTLTPARSSTLRWHSRHLQGLGTLLHLKIAHPDAAQANQALDAAVAVLGEIEASMSLFSPDSALQQLNRFGQLRPTDRHLPTVLREARFVARRSGGAFDPTVQPLWRMADRAAQAGRLPTAAERAQARALVDWRALEVRDDRITLTRPGMAVTLNGIAQGYAADAVRSVLVAHGVEHALIDTGEFSAWGRNERDLPWTLGIEDPHDAARILTALHLDGRSIATSADNRSTFTPDHRHHHIFDPATGDSPPALSSVTVAAASTMRADALTKVMFVAGPERIPQLARQWQVGVLWVDKSGRWEATPDLRLA